jgi:Do/DeqQ family serine protease
VFSSRTVRTQSMAPIFEEDPILRRFFGVEPSEPSERKQQGLGSGVVVRTDGYILTNNHVVENADEVKVGFADSPEEYVAKVIGTDPKTDVAVLKIDPGKRPLTPIVFGDSSKAEVGDVVFAIGNPFGVGQTVTMGIISAVGRGVGLAEYEDFLQTDASINPGNSGGALVDSNGSLLGINTAIISPTGANLGIGFAVPASLAHNVMTSIIEKGKVVRGYLGVMIQPIDPLLARKLGLHDEQGGLVADVQPDSPAAKAGLQSADVILALNGTPAEDARHLRLLIAQMVPGSKVQLTVWRDGKHLTLNATLQDLADAPSARTRPRAVMPEPEHQEGQIGIVIDDLDDELRARLRLPDTVHGAVLREIRPGSRGEDAGLKPGMVIVEVERKPVTSAEEAKNAILAVHGDILLTLYVDGSRTYRVIPHG